MSLSSMEYQSQPQPMEAICGANDFIDRQEVETIAWNLIDQRNQLPKIEVRTQERRDNARTAIMEALTASGHLSSVEINGTFDEINAQILNRLLNGWDESLPGHEKDRRFAELCNELVIQRVHHLMIEGFLPPDTEVCEISDYPEALRGLSLGYRDTNKKGMVRTTGLVSHGDGRYTRVIEQVSRSNGSQPSTFNFLGSINIQTENKAPDISALEAPSIYSRHDYVDGVVDVMKRLDYYSGSGVMYGDDDERVAKHPAYENLREESARREEEMLCYVDDLADLEEQLDQELTTKEEAMEIYKGEVERILNAICTLNPGYTEDTFGPAMVQVFEQVSVLTAQGRNQEAMILLQDNNHLKETVTFCGISISAEKASEMGLKVNSYGQLVEKGKDSWKWKQGTCVVKSCSTRPGKTEVGPCSVCKSCQRDFDKGRDPTKKAA